MTTGSATTGKGMSTERITKFPVARMTNRTNHQVPGGQDDEQNDGDGAFAVHCSRRHVQGSGRHQGRAEAVWTRGWSLCYLCAVPVDASPVRARAISCTRPRSTLE